MGKSPFSVCSRRARLEGLQMHLRQRLQTCNRRPCADDERPKANIKKAQQHSRTCSTQAARRKSACARDLLQNNCCCQMKGEPNKMLQLQLQALGVVAKWRCIRSQTVEAFTRAKSSQSSPSPTAAQRGCEQWSNVGAGVEAKWKGAQPLLPRSSSSNLKVRRAICKHGRDRYVGKAVL